jgi:CHAT domain-containing protein/Tfp pilus assembly protein PilF
MIRLTIVILIIFVLQSAGEKTLAEAEKELAGGNYQKAEALFSSLTTQTRQNAGMKRALRCRALIGLATAEWRQRKLSEASKTIQRALLLSRQPSLKQEQARALSIKGSIARANKQPDQAIAAFSAAAKIYEQLEERKAAADALSGLVESYRDRGERNQAIEIAERVIALRERTEDRPGLISALFSLGLLHSDQGKYDRASATYERALGLAQATGDKINVALALNRLGNVQNYLGAYDRAQHYYEQAVENYEAANSPVRAAGPLQNLSAVAFFRADYRRAVAYSERALKIFEQNNDEEKILIALNNLSLYYSEQGDFKHAFEYYERAIKLAEKRSDERAQATSLARLGAIYMAQREYNLAIEYFQRALKLQTLAANRKEMNVLPVRIGQALIELKDYDRAIESIDQALASARKTGERLDIAEALATRARALYGKKERDGALKAVSEVLSLAEALNAPALYWRAFYLQGVIARDSGDTAAAISLLQQAAGYLRSIRNRLAGGQESDQFFLAGERQRVYLDLIELLIKTGRTAEALEYIEETRQRELTNLYRKAGSRPANPAEANAYERLQSLAARVRSLDQELMAAADPARNRELQEKLSALQAEQDSFTQNLLHDYPRVAEIAGLKPTSLASIQASLPDGVLVLEPFSLTDQVVIFAFDKKQLLMRAIPLKPEELDRTAGQLRAAFSRSRSTNPEQMKKLGRQIYEWLIGPFESELAQADHLIVITSGKLRYLPIQALWSGERYLIERIPISYVATAASLIFYTESGSNSNRTGALAIGNPLAADRLLALPYAEEETREIGKLFSPRATIRIGVDATKANLRTDAVRADLIHFATHAMLDAQQPERSYILMAGENDEERRLNYGEIPELEPQLHGASLVTLSACETALGRETEGLEISGLSEQFRQAGVRSVIASLWKVSDLSTKALMTEFYSQVKAGRSRANALREAQLKLIRSSRADFNDPFFWAPFILIGDYR